MMARKVVASSRTARLSIRLSEDSASCPSSRLALMAYFLRHFWPALVRAGLPDDSPPVVCPPASRRGGGLSLAGSKVFVAMTYAMEPNERGRQRYLQPLTPLARLLCAHLLRALRKLVRAKLAPPKMSSKSSSAASFGGAKISPQVQLHCVAPESLHSLSRLAMNDDNNESRCLSRLFTARARQNAAPALAKIAGAR